MSEQVRLKDISLGWFDEEVGQALRSARGTRTQASVAKAVNRQSGHISRVELGKTPISFEEAVRLTKELPVSFSVRNGVCRVELRESVQDPPAAVDPEGLLQNTTSVVFHTKDLQLDATIPDPVEVAARYAETGRLPEDEGCSCVGVCAVTGTSKCWTYDSDSFEVKVPEITPAEELDSVFAVSEPGPDNRNVWKRLKDWWIGKEFISEPQPRISVPPSDPASS